MIFNIYSFKGSEFSLVDVDQALALLKIDEKWQIEGKDFCHYFTILESMYVIRLIEALQKKMILLMYLF